MRLWHWLGLCAVALLQACGGGEESQRSRPSTSTVTEQRQQALAYQSDLGFDPQANQVDERVASINGADVAGAFMPDGRLLTLSLYGNIGIANVVNGTHKSIYTIPDVYAKGEKGALDIELDPGFSSNRTFYVYYSSGTVATNTRLRIAAYVLSTSDVVSYRNPSQPFLWSNPGSLSSVDYHIGGSLKFGNDGKLYLTVGDGTISANSQSLTNVHGKILRLNADGTVPTDNPFYDGAGPNIDEIYAYGLRNTFRISVDRVTGTMWLGDVGGNNDQTAYEEVNILQRGANYGWPLCEGPLGQPKAGPNCPAGITPPIHYYPHVIGGACCFNRSVTGGFVYRGSRYPAQMQGIYVYGDYAGGFIEWLKPSAGLTARQAGGSFAASSTPTSSKPVWFGVGADGHIYYIGLGGQLRRLRYTGTVSNQPPTITTATATPASGATPLTVQFQGVATDPEGDAITYSWSFGDGSPAEAAASPSHVYTTAGAYKAVLTVTAGGATVTSNQVSITVGTPPTAEISSPANNSQFAAGDTINISGTGNSPDFGPLPGSALKWEVLFAHNDHTHPAMSGTGSTLVLPIDKTGHGYEGNTRFIVNLTATDSLGRTGTAQITLLPHKVPVGLATNLPAAGTATVDGVVQNLPFTIDTIRGFEHELSVPASVCAGNVLWNFQSWSQGGARTHIYTVPATAATLTATYANAGTACNTGPQNYLASGGQVVFEAEGFDAAVAQSGKTWNVSNTPAGASGSFMVAGPNTGLLLQSNIPTTSPRLDYRILFETAGTYAVWLRSHAPSDPDNSIFFGLNGSVQGTLSLNTYGSTLWSRAQHATTVLATLVVPSPGIHTFNVWMREDGYPIDKFLLTTSSSFTPSGAGPAASARGYPAPDTTPPAVQAVSPIAAATGQALTVTPAISFSEPVVNFSAITLAPAAGGSPVAATVSLAGNVATLRPAAALLPNTAYLLTVPTSVTDAAGNPLASAYTSTFTTGAAAPTALAYVETGGLVAFDADGFDAASTLGGKTWTLQSGMMVALPNTGTMIATNVNATSPRLTYRVRFASAGTYRVWVLGQAANDLDNSLYVGLNNVESASLTLKTYNSPLWSNMREGPRTPVTITVPSPGMHTFHVWMREDGYFIDRIVLTPSTTYVPTGSGPPTSPRQDSMAGAAAAALAPPPLITRPGPTSP